MTVFIVMRLVSPDEDLSSLVKCVRIIQIHHLICVTEEEKKTPEKQKAGMMCLFTAHRPPVGKTHELSIRHTVKNCQDSLEVTLFI